MSKWLQCTRIKFQIVYWDALFEMRPVATPIACSLPGARSGSGLSL